MRIRALWHATRGQLWMNYTSAQARKSTINGGRDKAARKQSQQTIRSSASPTLGQRRKAVKIKRSANFTVKPSQRNASTLFSSSRLHPDKQSYVNPSFGCSLDQTQTNHLITHDPTCLFLNESSPSHARANAKPPTPGVPANSRPARNAAAKCRRMWRAHPVDIIAGGRCLQSRSRHKVRLCNIAGP